MQQQAPQPLGPKRKFDLKRILYSARVTLFVIIVIGIILAGLLWLMTGATIYSSLSTVITSVATVLAVSSFFIPAPSASTQPTVSPSAGNMASATPNAIQNGNASQSTDVKTGQPIFCFNLPLRDPSEFYGHDAARTTLITRTANGGSTSIVGERRSGKTWLLTYLQLVTPTHSKLGQTHRIAYVSATHPQNKTLEGFVRSALEELKFPQSSYDPSLQPLSQLSRSIRILKKLGTSPVLCIDEFEGFNNRQEFNVDFVEGLRAMAQDDGLALVIASRSPLKELIEDLTGQTSPLFNIVQQISLYPFTEQEAREFVYDKSNIAGFTKKESEFFFSQSTLHNTSGDPYWPPLRLQLVGQMLLDDKQSEQGRPLDDKLDEFRYQSEFEKHLDESYQAVVR